MASPQMPRILAYSYIRMSTKEQLQGDSLRRQYEKAEIYAKENKLELVENYDDIGVSAFRGANEQGRLGDFLAAVRSNVVSSGSYLIVESMDRLTRQTPIAAISTFNEIIMQGIVVVTLDDGMRYSAEDFAANQYKLFIAVGAMMRAHEESLRKSGLLSDTWSQKRRLLVDEGRVLTSMVPAWLQVNKSKNVIDVIPERVAIVKEIFDLTCNGHGIYSIASILNKRNEKAWGITRRTNIRAKNEAEPIWRDSYIKKILANRAVLGEFQPHKNEITPNKKKVRIPVGEMIDHYYPKIITPEVFREAQLATERRRNGARGRKGSGYSNLFTGMIHCEKCGSAMRYLDKGGGTKESKFLKCSVAVSGGKCDPRSYRYEAVEKVLLSNLESLDIQKVISGDAVSARIGQKKSERELTRIELESITKKIISLNAALIGDDGPLPSSTLSLLRSLENDQLKKKSSIEILDSEIDDLLVIDPERRKAVLNELMVAIKDPDDDRRAKSRRALAGELLRMIDTIVLRNDIEASSTHYPAEHRWNELLPGMTEKEIEKHLSDYGFEASIRYRNGEQMFISGIFPKRLKMKLSRNFLRMKSIMNHGVYHSEETGS